jgi:hypothetical protein
MPSRPSDRSLHGHGLLGPLCAAFLFVFGLLPLADWIPGGESVPAYGDRVQEWLSGTAIAVGVGVVLAILARRLAPGGPSRLTSPLIAASVRYPYATTASVTLIALSTYVAISRTVFDTHPILIDEIVQVAQARTLAGGRLWQPTPLHPEFFSTLNVVEHAGRVFAQFPVGGPAMLVPGVLLGIPWIMGPIFGALAVLAYTTLLHTIEPRAGVRLGAALLFALSPFSAFMAGSHMNHVPTLAWLLVASATLARVVTSPHPQPGAAFINGLALGVAAAIRPVDAAAFALPAAGWYLARALRSRRRWTDAVAAGLGIALPLAALLVANARTTGAPLLFGYDLLWGKEHSLGFHRTPWGTVHTPARGLELLNLYCIRLQTYLFEAPVPSLLPATVALALARRLAPFDRYLLVSSALLAGFYWAYWHDGFFLGPRFVYSWVPVLALWTARLPALVHERVRSPSLDRVMASSLAAVAAIAVLTGVPPRARQYAASYATERWDADSASASAGVRHALVFVRESWQSQLVARMWALGIPRSAAEGLFGRIDACRLNAVLDSLERVRLRGPAATAAVSALAGDSAAVVSYRFPSGATVRLHRGTSTVPPRCARRLADDAAGVWPLAPLLLAHGGDNIYARDLHGRDTLLLEQYPGRALYLLRPSSGATDAAPRFYPASRDSIRLEARRDSTGSE